MALDKVLGGVISAAEMSRKERTSDDQQGPPVQHRELYSISCDKPQRTRARERIYTFNSEFAVQQKVNATS